MSQITKAETYLLEQIRTGQPQAWRQLVDRYQGRLYAFAQSRLRQPADADDIVQETFIAFLKSLDSFRADASLETYLFSILRRKIVDCFRGRQVRKVCLLQDVYQIAGDGVPSSDPFARIPGPDPTASWYVSADEQHLRQRDGLTQALRELFDRFKKSNDLRDLQVVELLFYCHLANKDVAKVMGLAEGAVAVIKHRCLKQVRNRVAQLKLTCDPSAGAFDQLLSEICCTQRLSCLKRSTIGSYLLGTLDPRWHDYVDFHLNRLGCLFCRANLDDLEQQNAADEQSSLHQRIMQSTVGFLRKP